jgi:hypothetical protein
VSGAAAAFAPAALGTTGRAKCGNGDSISVLRFDKVGPIWTGRGMDKVLATRVDGGNAAAGGVQRDANFLSRIEVS